MKRSQVYDGICVSHRLLDQVAININHWSPDEIIRHLDAVAEQIKGMVALAGYGLEDPEI